MEKAEKLAVIDCGTNTFHLMIAEINHGKFNIVSREKIPVKIGEGGINKDVILQEPAQRALDALSHFKDKIDRLDITKIQAFATSAFRNASNGQELAKKIENEIGIAINIISGDREAELIFKGVRHALKLSEPTMVMDIGGGSVEFIIGTDDEILWKRSFEIGGQRLVEYFHAHDPILPEDIESLEQYAEKELKELFDALSKYNPTLLAGSSGTFDTLSDIYRYEQGIEASESLAELPLTFEAYTNIHQELISKNKEERLAIPGMIPLRVEMIVVASCLINVILKNHQFDKLKVSTYSLKEGLLAELTEK